MYVNIYVSTYGGAYGQGSKPEGGNDRGAPQDHLGSAGESVGPTEGCRRRGKDRCERPTLWLGRGVPEEPEGGSPMKAVERVKFGRGRGSLIKREETDNRNS